MNSTIAIKSVGFKSVRKIPLPDHLQELEVISALITTAQDRKVLFCSFYRPPDLDLSWVNLYNSFLDLVCEDFEKMVICGDFNYPKIPYAWEFPDSSRGANEQAFVVALHVHFLTQIQRNSTRGTNILDLVITSVPDLTTVLDVLDINNAGLFADHRTVFFEFHTSVKAPAKTHRSVYDYARGDFIGLRNAFCSVNRPFATNDHMVQNPPCWSASSLLFPHWDITTKRPEPVKLDLPLF